MTSTLLHRMNILLNDVFYVLFLFSYNLSVDLPENKSRLKTIETSNNLSTNEDVITFCRLYALSAGYMLDAVVNLDFTSIETVWKAFWCTEEVRVSIKNIIDFFFDYSIVFIYIHVFTIFSIINRVVSLKSKFLRDCGTFEFQSLAGYVYEYIKLHRLRDASQLHQPSSSPTSNTGLKRARMVISCQRLLI